MYIFSKEVPSYLLEWDTDDLYRAGLRLHDGRYYIHNPQQWLVQFYDDRSVLYSMVRDNGSRAVMQFLNDVMDTAIKQMTARGYTLKGGGTSWHYDYHHARIAMKFLGVYRDRYADYHHDLVERRARKK